MTSSAPRRHNQPRFTWWRKCSICGQSFETTRRDSKMCGATCRKRASRLQPAIDTVNAGLDAARTAAQRSLFDEPMAPARSPIDDVLDALRSEWPDLRPWIKAMLERLARKRNGRMAAQANGASEISPGGNQL
jgi:hypothetical protein